MKFIEDFTKNVTKVASKTVKKTEQITETAKLKLNLHLEESKLSKCFEDIGRAYYGIKKNNEDRIPDIASYFVQADEIKMTIQAIKTELAALNNSIICPKCKSEVSENAVFCSVCGLKVEKKTETFTCCCDEAEEECCCDEDCSCGCNEAEEECSCGGDCSCSCDDTDTEE